MKALIYLIKRTAANNLKKAVRKPTTLLALIFGAAYGIFLIVMLGTLAVIGRCELLLAVFGGIFVVETLSVILQVTSFKLTGKRIFKMSPIHHHFELSGHSEIRIVKEFAFVSTLFAITALVLNYIL